jgi:hypothetical protein
LIHWNEKEAERRIQQLEAAGYTAFHEPVSPAMLRKLRNDPPSAVVIDLSRAPSQGRDSGVALRHYKSTREVPLVFVDGDKHKVAAIRQLLPDAMYTSWGRIKGALERAIAHPARGTMATPSLLAGYSGTPLPKKLGIKQDTTIILVGSPQDFETTLGPLPEGVTLRKQARGKCDLIIWFAKSRKDLEQRVKQMADLAGKGGIWIAWPKQASGAKSDLTQAIVRGCGLAAGLVDYKICSIDETWSGLKFTKRKTK